MKKSIFSAFVVFPILILSCRKIQNEQQPSSDKILEITLNGINKITARKEIEYFDEHKASNPAPINTSVWFDYSIMRQMVELLKAKHADGVRIYFVNDLAEGVPSKNSIVLVSTKAWGKNPAVSSGTYHQDYYQHSATAALFNNTKTIHGVVN